VASNNVVPLHGEHITLAQALKAVGLADTGGQAKMLVRHGRVQVNGAVETRPGRKLFAGDRFTAGDAAWVIVPSSPAAGEQDGGLQS
jgi:ribosome-associated protein